MKSEVKELIDNLILRLELSKELSNVCNQKMEAVNNEKFGEAARLQNQESELIARMPNFDIDAIKELRKKL